MSFLQNYFQTKGLTKSESSYYSTGRKKILDISLIAFVIAITLVVNFFHFPLYFHSIEIERFEMGMAIVLVLTRRIATKNLVYILTILPLVDQLQHGHNLITIPLEMFFNLYLLFVFQLSLKLIGNKSKWTKAATFCCCFFLVIVIKTIYLIAIVYVFMPDVDVFQSQNSEQIQKFLYFIFLPYFIIIAVKFSVILGISVTFNN